MNVEIDRSTFARLKRMFSNGNGILFNAGGKKLKFIDTEKIQSNGTVQTNVSFNRYNRLFRTGGIGVGLNPSFNYPAQRIQMYNDYELMDNETLIGNVLDVVAEEAALKSPEGNILTIKSSNDAIEKVLNSLFYQVMNIEFNLAGWVRNMAKYGDFFLHLTLADGYGVINVDPLSVYTTEREEKFDPNNPNAVRFRVNDYGAGYGTSNSDSERFFQNYEIAHFRLIGDMNYLPYGKSYIEIVRKTYKQYVLLKDALLLHQIMRAPEKRIFNVDVGNLPPNEIEPFIQKFMNNIKKVPYVDPQTGEYNLKYNLQNSIEDFILPKRGNQGGTTIETTKGLENQGATDVVEFLRDELLSGLKVPKSFIGFEADVSGKSTLSAQSIRFAGTIDKIQRIVVSELTKIALVHLTMQGYDNEEITNFELKLTTPSIVLEQERVALLQEKAALGQSLMDTGMFSTDWILENIFDMSEENYVLMREGVLADKKRMFRFGQIENEGNDPNISGKSYGTTHDLAILQGLNRNNSGATPTASDVVNPEGRPKEHASDYGSQYNSFGRDTLGKDNLIDEPHIVSYKPEFNGASPMSLSESKLMFLKNVDMLKSIKPDKPSDSLLSEDNILDI